MRELLGGYLIGAERVHQIVSTDGMTYVPPLAVRFGRTVWICISPVGVHPPKLSDSLP